MFAWTGRGLWHSLSPVVVLATAGDYYPCICPVDKFEKLVLNNVLLEQTQGGLALASNSYGYGGHYMYYVKLGMNNPISFTARVAPESEFVRWEFYASGEETPFLTANKTRVDMHWTQAANAIVRAVTRYPRRCRCEVGGGLNVRLPPIFDHGTADLRWNLRSPVPCRCGPRAACP